MFYLLARLAYLVYGIKGVCLVLRHTPGGWPTEKILRKFGAHIGENITFEGYLRIFNAEKDFSNLQIQRKAYIGQDVFLDIIGRIVIEEEAVIAMNVSILTHQEVGIHRALDEIIPTKKEMVRISRGAFVGEGVTIMCGTRLGETSCLGAKSLMNRTVPEKQLWAGNPARFVRFLEVPEPNIDEVLRHCVSCKHSGKKDGEEVYCYRKEPVLAKMERSNGPCGSQGKYFEKKSPSPGG